MQRVRPSRPFRTFTIEVGHELGCETEWAKLERRAAEGRNPDLFIQGYYAGDTLLAVGGIRTDALVQFCQQHQGDLKRLHQGANARRPGRQFWVASWDKLIERGYVPAYYEPGAGWQGQHPLTAWSLLAYEPYDEEPGSRDGDVEYDDDAPEYAGLVLSRSTYDWLDDDDAARLDYLLTSDRT